MKKDKDVPQLRVSGSWNLIDAIKLMDITNISKLNDKKLTFNLSDFSGTQAHFKAP